MRKTIVMQTINKQMSRNASPSYQDSTRTKVIAA
jgi:hypothetical protein